VGLSPFYDIVSAIVAKTRSIAPESVTIIGGGLVSSEPKIVIEAIRPCSGIIGEGEEAIVDLIEHLRANKPYQDVKGIVYLDHSGNAVVTEARPAIDNLDALPFPDL